MPTPTRIAGCVLWDIKHLDGAFDALSEARDEDDPWKDTLQ